ncbi:hypothetical protein MSAN_00929900 [Mycena sanguinolenta]|uniref:F-box domain-containing protein n=1 Tax=Mycena sanguinolenta TaxID=230812 RepID=A0A8H7DC64_9AGAR|nr:hypothetical protein MSAN_00929900 [Mycena sanguinolenta]
MLSWLRWRNPRRNDDAEGCILPQELVDECLSYLHYEYQSTHQPNDLMACALVCKSWSLAAQRHLFKIVRLGTTRRRSHIRLLDRTLRASPHLIQHIHSLVLYRGPLVKKKNSINIAAFEKICNISYTHLESVFFLDGEITFTLRYARALQRLLSLPTLCQVNLSGTFPDPAAFCAVWDRCSPTIKHLELHCRNHIQHDLHPTASHSSASVALRSLKLNIYSFNGVDEWLNHDLCPFDFSQLAVLSVTNPTLLGIGRSRMIPALQTIRALEFNIGMFFDENQLIDLSLFSNLQFLRISFYCHPHLTAIALDTLSTLVISSAIRHIVMSFWPTNIDAHWQAVYDQFDSKIDGLQLQHLLSVGLEMDVQDYTCMAEFFPRLHSRNLLCRSDSGWFERRREAYLQ